MHLTGATPVPTRSVTYSNQDNSTFRISNVTDSEIFDRCRGCHRSKRSRVLTAVVHCVRMVKTPPPVIGKWPASFSSAHFQLIPTDFRQTLSIGSSKKRRCPEY